MKELSIVDILLLLQLRIIERGKVQAFKEILKEYSEVLSIAMEMRMCELKDYFKEI